MITQNAVKIPLLLTGPFLAAASVSWSQETMLLASWNFNDGDALEAVSHGVHANDAALDLSEFTSGVENFAGSTLNLVGSDAPGGSLSIQGGAGLENNGKSATFIVPMTGYEDLVLTYATRGTSTGFSEQVWLWSTDGVAFTEFQTMTGTTSTTYNVRTIILPMDLDDQERAWLRVSFNGATASAGNNRIDNVQFNATPIPEPSTYAAMLGLAGLIGALACRHRR